MDFENSRAFAQSLDEQDELKQLRKEFLIPQHEGKDAVYLCGNSLGLQPVKVAAYLQKQLTNWHNLAVEGWFNGEEPWLQYHQQLRTTLGSLVGALEDEVTVMNSLTVNLHLLLVSFYQPNSKRYKIFRY